MLGAYLMVLVPLNWVVFRAVRRVEWAWVAVPLIAMAGAVVVTKAANLNIGFARSQTEIGLLELHNGYSRGHLTRYTALYTSLSTSYDVKFDDPYAVVQPFEVPGRTRSPTWEPSAYTLRQEADVRLGGFGVSSNSTSMLHSEQMYDLGGAITYTDSNGPPTVVNRTRFTFPQAAVVRKTTHGDFQIAWLGQFAPGEVGRPLDFETIDGDTAVLPKWRNDPVPDPAIPPLSLAKMAQLVADRNALKAGEVRLVASLSEPLPGMEVDPVSSQAPRSAVLVVAHLRFGPARAATGPRRPRRRPRRAARAIRASRQNRIIKSKLKIKIIDRATDGTRIKHRFDFRVQSVFHPWLRTSSSTPCSHDRTHRLHQALRRLRGRREART